MKKIILSLAFIMLLLSCSKTSSGEASTAPQVKSEAYILKIKTFLYGTTGIKDIPANELIEISVGDDTKLNNIPLESLVNGIPLPKDSLVTIKAIRIDKKVEEGYEEKAILWLGYSDNEDEARNSQIEVEMSRDKQFTLVVSDDPTIPVVTAKTSLEINSTYNKNGEGGRIEGVGVEIDGVLYTEEFQYLVFVKGQLPVFKAIVPENNPDIEFVGFKIDNVAHEGLTISDIEMKDGMYISTKFIDKTSLGVNVSIVGLDDERGTVQTGGTNLVGDSVGTAIITEQQVGTKIQLTAIPKENYQFTGWSINGANVSTSATFIYIVENQDAEILALFIPEKGPLMLI